MSKFKIVARAKLRKKAQAEREAKNSKRPRQLPWKKSRDGASQVLNDRVTERVTFKEYLINEARYHGSNNMEAIHDFIERNFYVWGEDRIGPQNIALTIEESGRKYNISANSNSISVRPGDTWLDEDEAHKRAKQIEQRLQQIK